MKKNLLYFFLLLYSFSTNAQDGFHFVKNSNKVSIPFKLINNLVFIPLNVNGVELTFLLDTGVEETVLFSLEDKKEINLKNIEKISLKGLGSEEAVEGLKSTGNLLEVKGMESRNHLLYIILDPDFNLSSHIGIPVNGIIGYSFFKNNLVEINYDKKRIFFYQDNGKNKRRIEKKYKKLPISIERAKPYIVANVMIDSVNIASKLLVDIGNSDAVWLFQNVSDKIKVPNRNFEDYLGKGFSGDVEGRRARISEFTISDFKFSNLVIAFPDSNSVKHVKMVPNRFGSVGGEILKRFSIVFDYPNNSLYFRKGKEYFAPFNYNKSGIEIRHSGMQWVQETVHLQTVPVLADTFDSKVEKKTSDFQYKFKLKPIYEIANLRKNSPAALCGLQLGDVIVSINSNLAHKYTLQQMNSFLKSEDEKWITVEVLREGVVLKFKFQLQNIL